MQFFGALRYRSKKQRRIKWNRTQKMKEANGYSGLQGKEFRVKGLEFRV